ncbi:MAG TPA: sulfur transferase domain-containing protein [Caulobacterales bacterium]|nr:sulfur transferase domain-containing protein [Caulobacterales bacterium]
MTDALSPPQPPFEIADAAARRRAWTGLMWRDHGFLRIGWSNFHWISPEMARANQPSPKRIAHYAAQGFKTIVNLRGESEAGHYLLEREACAAAGMKLVTFQVRSRDMLSKEQVIGAKALFDEIAYPALMHCKSGADRAGIMAALYVMLRQGKRAEEAVTQLSRKYGHFREGKTGILDFFFETYLAETKGEKPLLDWVREDYDPAATKQKFMSQWWANIWVDKILRRE